MSTKLILSIGAITLLLISHSQIAHAERGSGRAKANPKYYAAEQTQDTPKRGDWRRE